MSHSAERTNEKGQPFIGTCWKCGKTGLTMKMAMAEECPNTTGSTQEQDLLRAIEGSEQQVIHNTPPKDRR